VCAKRQPPSATTSKRDETSSCTAAHTEDKTTLLDHSTATATTARLGGNSTGTARLRRRLLDSDSTQLPHDTALPSQPAPVSPQRPESCDHTQPVSTLSQETSDPNYIPETGQRHTKRTPTTKMLALSRHESDESPSRSETNKRKLNE